MKAALASRRKLPINMFFFSFFPFYFVFSFSFHIERLGKCDDHCRLKGSASKRSDQQRGTVLNHC